MISNVVEEITLPALIPPAQRHTRIHFYARRTHPARRTIASLLDRLQVNDPSAADAAK
jgi:hypothetical protein